MARLVFIRRVHSGVAVAALAIVLAACGARSTPYGQATPSPGQPSKTTIHTYLQEWSIRAEPASAKTGEISFMAHNQGTGPHELVVVKTSLAADRLPVGTDGKVIEGGPVEVVGEIEPEELSPTMVATKTFSLAAGDYVLVCNIENHYSQGMRTVFTVTA